MAGKLSSSGKFASEELYRFANKHIERDGYLCWDFEHLQNGLFKGLQQAAQRYDNIVSIGIDTWGVDYVLVDKEGDILGNMVCYRDKRTEGMQDAIDSVISRRELYGITGIQNLYINTIFQLYSQKLNEPELLQRADRLLFTPDLFNYILSGKMTNEYTIASTSGLLDASTQNWAYDLIDKLGLPRRIFGEITHPMTTLGRITPDVAALTGLSPEVQVICVGSHDTQSAIAATPALYEEGSAFLSSGTWSLLGCSLDNPILSAQAEQDHFTNEGGLDNKISFLQNITGLWILQSLMREWGKSDYQEVVSQAESSVIETVIDVDDPLFAAPESMQDAIDSYCQREGMIVPSRKGDYVKTVFLSLASKYRQGVKSLSALLPHRLTKLYIFGGGTASEMLNQMSADATELELYICSSEATTIGNIMAQAIAVGDITMEEIKVNQLIENAAMKIYSPRNV